MSTPLTYTIQLEPAEEGGYVVTVPAIPAIVTEGDSYEEALAMAEDAIKGYIEFCVERGMQIPVEKPSSARLNARIQVQPPAAV